MTKILEILAYFGFRDPKKAYQDMSMDMIYYYIRRYYSENK